MKKSKDPAFLFYPSDFIMGTYTMTDEQVGKYIRLLCLQFSKGKLTERDMLSINRDDDPYVKEKFTFEDGLYFNERLLKEVEERERKAQVNRENGSKGGNPLFEKGKDNPYYNRKDNQTVMLSDNRKDKQKINIALENENIDLNVIKNDLEVKDDLKESIKIIIDYLNQKTNKQFKYDTAETIKHIKGRLNDGYTLEDFQHVIDVKCNEWLGTDFEKHLAPPTLFRPSNFEKYANQKVSAKKQIDDWYEKEYKRTGKLL